jgi:hypothetical protein
MIYMIDIGTLYRDFEWGFRVRGLAWLALSLFPYEMKGRKGNKRLGKA